MAQINYYANCHDCSISVTTGKSLDYSTNEPRHDKTKKMSVHPAKTQISLGIFAVRMKKPWVFSYPLSA